MRGGCCFWFGGLVRCYCFFFVVRREWVLMGVLGCRTLCDVYAYDEAEEEEFGRGEEG